MRKSTLKSNYNFISLLETLSGVSQNCDISKLWAKINGDEGSSKCPWTKTFNFNVIVKHEKSSFQVMKCYEMLSVAIFSSSSPPPPSPPPRLNIVLCKLNGPDKESVWTLSVLFLSKVKFSFDDSTAWKSSAKHFLWARRRGFSHSLSALALSQVVMSQALEEKRQNEEYKTLDD